MLFPYAPQPPPNDLAGMKRNLPFLLELAKANEVSVLAYGTAAEEQVFRSAYGHLLGDIRFVDTKRPRLLNGLERVWLLGTGRSAFRQLYRPAMQAALDAMTRERRYDVIHTCVQFFGYFRFPAGVAVTSDTHEVKYLLLQRTAQTVKNPLQKLEYSLGARFGRQEEMALCRKFDALVATTDADLEVFRRDLPTQRIEVISNGAGTSFLEDLGVEPEPCSMVFTGYFRHLPNSQGLLWFLDEVFPLIQAQSPRAKVYVVGKSPTKELLARAGEKIVVTGFVEDVRPYMARGQVFIIPLLAGGGIRGKALEAMAMRRPIVSTTVGVEGIRLRAGESALFGDTPAEFAQAVLRLFGDAELRARLVRTAFATVNEHYVWAAKGRELDRLLRSVVAERAKSAAGN